VFGATHSRRHEPDRANARGGHLTAIPRFWALRKHQKPSIRAFAQAVSSGTPSPPFRECPAIGADQSCGILIYVTNQGAKVISDPSEGPYDGGDDTLVGVLNASSKDLSSLSLSSNTDIFGFDGDGICTYSGWVGDAGCPYGDTGYEGPGTAFSPNGSDTGAVVFTNTLPPGGVAYFGLENALSQASLANPTAYVALGDSYSSGQGTQNPAFSPACVRTPGAWPILLGADSGGNLVISGKNPSNSFFACSGATSTDILNGGPNGNQPHGEPGQVLPQLEDYVENNGSPGLVTLTAGGDDIHFGNLVSTCYNDMTGSGCLKVLAAAIQTLTTHRQSLVARLANLYSNVASTAGSATKVEVVGYPKILPPASAAANVGSHCWWVTGDTTVFLSDAEALVVDLNDDIRQAASDAHVDYASIANALAGHELCTGDAWVGSLGIPQAIKKTAGHPLPEGQNHIAKAVLADLQGAGLPLASKGRNLASANVSQQPADATRSPVVRRSHAGSALTSRFLSGGFSPQSAEALTVDTSGVTQEATLHYVYVGFLTATGGIEPYTWSVTSGLLPEGLSLDPSTGVVSGETTSVGRFTFTVTATDSASPTPATASASVTIVSTAPAALSVATASLPSGTVGQQYSTTLRSSGGTNPVSWAVASGGLPTGLTLDPETGVVSGTPTASGTSTVTLRATDSSEPSAQAATATFVVSTVSEGAPLTITTSKLPTGTQGDYYSAAVNSTGGTAPIEWSVSSGTLPAGLTLNSSSGEISGIPSGAETSSVTISATDRTIPIHQVASIPLTLVVNAGTPLSIIANTVSQATQGTEYVTDLNAVGGVPGDSWQVTSGSLPPGLTLEGASGTIEGTPAESGTFTVNATVSDGSTPSPQTASETFSLTVAPSSPAITFAPPEATIGVPYSYTPSVNGGVAPYSWSSASGELPAGLSFDSSTGTISGTPTTAGSSALTLQVTDSSQPVAQSVTGAGTLTVAPAPALQILFSTLPGAINGVPYRALVFASGGTAPLSYSITSGSLAPGLSLEGESGVLTGVPSSEGTFEFTVQVRDSSEPSPEVRTATLLLTVTGPPALSVSTSELEEATAGSPFSQSLVATGGSPPYTWSITSGALPGLSVSEGSGQISGTPTEPGTFSFTAKVTDSSSPSAQTATVSLSLTVNAFSPLDITTGSLPSAEQGDYYQEVVEAQGGVGPYSWSVASGALPEGLSLDPTTGEIYGVPTAYGTSSFTLAVSDSSSPTPQTASASFTVAITPAPPLAVSATLLAAGTQGQYYDQSLGISGGVQPYSVTVTSGSLPEGITLNTYGELYGEITSSQSETVTVTVRDGSTPAAQTISRQYTIDVTPAPALGLAATVPSFVIGEYNYEPLDVSGGVPGYTYTVLKSKLPGELSFSNGAIYGTPTKLGKGTIEVKVTDSTTPTAHSVTKTVSVAVVKPPKLKFLTTKLPNAAPGDYYDQQIDASGGTPGYNWTVTAGSPPPGLNFSDGEIYGYPEKAGTYSFTVRVTDSGSPSPQTASKTFKLKVT
jgi:hypothetical protein